MPRIRRLSLVLSVLVSVVVVGASAAALWPEPIRGHAIPTAAELSRNRLALAQLGLINSPAVHFTGTLRTADSAQTAALDLTVANPGDATGTLTMAGGQAFAVAIADGKTFLRGHAAAWEAMGFSHDRAALFDDITVLTTPDDLGIDLSILAPARLGVNLDPAYAAGRAVVRGQPVDINGHRTIPISSDGVTTYIREPAAAAVPPTAQSPAPSTPKAGTPTTPGISPPTSGMHPALWREGPLPQQDPQPAAPETYPVIDRVVIDQTYGKTQSGPKWASIEVDTSALSSAAAQQFYDDFGKTFKTLEDSADSRFTVKPASQNAHFIPDPCGLGGCTASFTISNTVTSKGSSALPTSIYASYEITWTFDGGPVVPGPGCSGIVAMPPNGSVEVSCAASYSVPADGKTYTLGAHLQGHVQALDKPGIEKLLNVVAANAAAIRGMPNHDRPGDGEFKVRGRSMGAAVNAAYQAFVSGLPASVEYVICGSHIPSADNCVTYDGIDYQNKILDDAKGSYDQLIQSDGTFLQWVIPGMADEIRRQTAGLPDGYSLRINFMQERSKDLAESELRKIAGLDLSRVTFRYWPM